MKKCAKLVVITGCTRGLGRAMARGLAGRGWTVAGCGTTAAAVEALAAELGPPHRISVCDVSDTRAVEEFAAAVAAALGVPDLLVNNAAVINRNAPLWLVSAEDFSRVIDVNLKGTANIIRHFVPGMIAARRGVVVNFSSGWGRSTSPEVAPYCTTKWGVEGMTQALAQELPKGLAAVALNPGVINTEMLQSCFGADAASYPSPSAWAKVAVPFILGLSEEHNGQSLTVG